MVQINTPGTGHVGPTALPGGHQYLPYTNAAFLTTLKGAMATINTRIKGNAPCDNAFRALPGGRTFAQIWADNSIWINFDPVRVAGDYGASRGKEITLTAYTLAMGKWTVAATLMEHQESATKPRPRFGVAYLAD